MEIPTELGGSQPAVVGFDDIQLAACANPLMITIRQPKYAMGAAAVTLQMEAISDRELTSHLEILEAQLVVCEPAVRDHHPRG